MKDGLKRKPLILGGICVFVTALFAFLSANRFIWLEDAEKGAVNYLYNKGRTTPVNTNIVFIGIDKATYNEELHEDENKDPATAWDHDPVAVAVRGAFPWNRSVWASVCEKLLNEGASVILIDIVFASIGKELEHDHAFRDVIRKHGDKIVIGWTVQNDEGNFAGENNFTFQLPAETVIDADPLTGSTIESPNAACVAIFPEEDGTVRRAYYTITTRELMERYLPPLDEAAELMEGDESNEGFVDDLSPDVGSTNLSAEDMALLLEAQQGAANSAGGTASSGSTNLSVEDMALLQAAADANAVAAGQTVISAAGNTNLSAEDMALLQAAADANAGAAGQTVISAAGNTNLSAEDMALLQAAQAVAAADAGTPSQPVIPAVGNTNLSAEDMALLQAAEAAQAVGNESDSMGAWDETISLEEEETYHDFLATKAARVLGLDANIPAHGTHPMFRYTGAPGTFPQLPLIQIVHPRSWKENYEGNGTFDGKIVLIGPTANIFQDKHRTPFTYTDAVMLGPEIHLNMLNALLQKEFLHEATLGANQLIIWLSGLISLLITVLLKRPYVRLILGAGICLSYLKFGVLHAYNNHNLFLIAIAPIGVVMTSFGLALVVELVAEQLARFKLTMTMNKYFSPAVMKEVLDNPGSLESRSADVTLLLTDLRNSTPLAEQLGPKGMFSLLNQIFEAQTDSIMDQNGNLEHFLGDQFLSYWGAPQNQPDGPNQALRAARDLINRMEVVKQRQEPGVKAIFGYGVALHTGHALVGNKGSEKKMEYGLVGDTINEAARIEALTKYYGAQLLVSEAVMLRLTDPGVHRMVDRVIVKGKSEPVVLFELAQSKSPENFAEITQEFKAAFDLYEAGSFETAKPRFQTLVEDFNDGPSKVMVDRCNQLTANPPENWEGVWKMESK